MEIRIWNGRAQRLSFFNRQSHILGVFNLMEEEVKEVRSSCYAHPSAHVDAMKVAPDSFEFHIRILKVIC